jgi:hypothetical protein
LTCWVICAVRLQLMAPSGCAQQVAALTCARTARRAAPPVPMPAAASSALDTTEPSWRTRRSIPRVHPRARAARPTRHAGAAPHERTRPRRDLPIPPRRPAEHPEARPSSTHLVPDSHALAVPAASQLARKRRLKVADVAKGVGSAHRLAALRRCPCSSSAESTAASNLGSSTRPTMSQWRNL